MRKKWALMAIASLFVSPAPGLAAPERVDTADTAARLDRLELRITGDRAELRASELLSYHRVAGGVVACMRAAGKPIRTPPFVSRYDGFTDADLGFGAGRGSVFDSITDRGRRAILNELAAARAARAGTLQEPWGPVRPADVAALNRCTAPYQHRTYPDFEPPDGVYRLSGLPGLLGPIERDPAVVAAMKPYRACMKVRFGYDVTERTDFLYTPRISYRDAPVDGRPPNAAWTRGIRQIHAAFDADASCRLPAYRLAMRMLAPRIGPWKRQHREELDTVRAAWKQRVAEAHDLPQSIP
ncbi:hypothetical protein [Nucisporomicrobium flavum]|uniref:hypothetical protein n=1 Tax=Nucisporomicrobium flavum TaxID=2785915 RepID=UPI0018F3BDCB|nr:hypothetical protein [Nucisporomicrobium flavum]